jgi:acyl carrier protein
VEIKVEVRKYLIENLMTDGPAISLGDTTPLITGGLIDSIGMISLVRFIESRFGIVFAPREIDAQRLDTLDEIESLVSRKLAQAARAS